jgi:hypothetical protein
MHAIRTWGRRLVVGLLLVFAAGCTARPVLVPVKGVLKAGGQPVPDATVHLAPDPAVNPKGLDAYGQTDAQGKFTLRTPQQGDGVVAGKYKVLVTPPEYGPGKAMVGSAYQDHGRTPIEIEVPAAGLADWELKIDPRKE